jgi:hypothetical protein
VTDRAPFEAVSVNKIFGDFLPDTTTDECEERPSESDLERDDWLRENVPPHHG